MTKPEYSGAWHRVRRQVLQRDGHLCQIRMNGCTTQATCVDHIITVNDGGAWWDPVNLRAACAHCNNARIDRRGSDRWQSAKTRITLVVGPPGSDKSRYVSTMREDADLVVDYDAIAHALGGDHEATMVARNAVLGALRRGAVSAPRAWIISSNPDAESVFPHHNVECVDPGIDEMLSLPGIDVGLVQSWYGSRSGTGTPAAEPSRSWW